jgi:GlcNAc-P-P-Und epimerase
MMVHRDKMLNASLGEYTVDVFFHLEVKQHIFRTTPDDLREFRAVNVEGTRAWLAWCTKHSIRRFVYFSSIKAVRSSNDELDETAPGPGETPYGASKWDAEQLVTAWAEADAERSALIMRPAAVYGPSNTANMYAMVRALAEGRFWLVGRNENVKSIVSLRNVVAATLFLTARMEKGPRTFNLVDPASYSVRDLATMMAGLMGINWSERTLPLPIARICARIGDVLETVTGKNLPLNSVRLESFLETTHFSDRRLRNKGFCPPQTTAAGLAEMIEWFQGQITPPQK